MTSLEMVAATLSGKRMKAAKLKNAAQATAHHGLSTRVDTIVAIELAASCSPLRKSNVSAKRTSIHTRNESCKMWLVPKLSAADLKKSNMRRPPRSGSLDDDLGDNLSDVLA